MRIIKSSSEWETECGHCALQIGYEEKDVRQGPFPHQHSITCPKCSRAIGVPSATGRKKAGTRLSDGIESQIRAYITDNLDLSIEVSRLSIGTYIRVNLVLGRRVIASDSFNLAAPEDVRKTR